MVRIRTTVWAVLAAVCAVVAAGLIAPAQAADATYTVTASRACDGTVTVTGRATGQDPDGRFGFVAWPQGSTRADGSQRGTVVQGDTNADGETSPDAQGSYAEVVTLTSPAAGPSDTSVQYAFADSPNVNESVQSGSAPITSSCVYAHGYAGRACDGTVTLTLQASGLEPGRLYNAEASVAGGPKSYDDEERVADANGRWENTVTLTGAVGDTVDWRMFTPPTVRNTVATGTAPVTDRCATTNGSRITGERDCEAPDTLFLGFDVSGLEPGAHTLVLTGAPAFVATSGEPELVVELETGSSLRGNDEASDPGRITIPRQAGVVTYRLLDADGDLVLEGTFPVDACTDGTDPGAGNEPGTGTRPGTGTQPGTGTGTGAGAGSGAGAHPTTTSPTNSSTVPVVAAGAHGPRPTVLATTGSPADELALLGTSALVLGAAALALSRRTRRS